MIPTWTESALDRLQVILSGAVQCWFRMTQVIGNERKVRGRMMRWCARALNILAARSIGLAPNLLEWIETRSTLPKTWSRAVPLNRHSLFRIGDFMLLVRIRISFTCNTSINLIRKKKRKRSPKAIVEVHAERWTFDSLIENHRRFNSLSWEDNKTELHDLTTSIALVSITKVRPAKSLILAILDYSVPRNTYCEGGLRKSHCRLRSYRLRSDRITEPPS